MYTPTLPGSGNIAMEVFSDDSCSGEFGIRSCMLIVLALVVFGIRGWVAGCKGVHGDGEVGSGSLGNRFWHFAICSDVWKSCEMMCG